MSLVVTVIILPCSAIGENNRTASTRYSALNLGLSVSVASPGGRCAVV